MLKISNLKVNIKSDFSNPTQLLRILLSERSIENARLVKKSVDARRKSDIHFVCAFEFSVKNEEQFKARHKNVTSVSSPAILPLFDKSVKLDIRPVVTGCGPAGLFAALVLAKNGLNPIIIERGDRVENRRKKVSDFWSGKGLDTESNVQFGEGGAGTFSDGKLNTGTKDSLISVVLNEFYENGANEDILYNAKPHIGTDVLRSVVKNLREKIISLGGEFRFNTCLTDFNTENGRLAEITLTSDGKSYSLPCENLILATGHSARDTFELLKSKGVALQPKAFSVGVRIEHPQELINRIQYGNPTLAKYLGQADYKTAVHLSSGRSVYTFCMCPGGYVVASASEKNSVVTNGMSEHKRDAVNANSALLVGINPSDFAGDDALSGIKFQRELERKSFIAGGENYFAPITTVSDFMKNQKCRTTGKVNPSYKPGVTLTDFNGIFPKYIIDSLRMGISEISRKMNGFLLDDAIMTAVESRSSSPVKIVRDEKMQASIPGIFPCGEGSGYSGGITSSAVDGIKTAVSLIENNM